MSKFTAWIQASRLPSQAYIFFPILLGEMIAYCRTGTLNWPVFGVLHLFGLCIQLYIVYANDYADHAIDQLNTTYTMFSGGSRVLVDGKLSRLEIGVAAATMAACSLLAGGLLHIVFHRAFALLFVLLALFVLYAYSFPPIRLSYRGGGEILQMLGVAVLLPVFGYYAQTGHLDRFPLMIFWVLAPTNLACAIATSLADEPSDRQGDKRTTSVLLGNRGAKICILALNSFTIPLVAWNLLTEFGKGVQWTFLVSMVLPLLCAIIVYQRARPGTRQLEIFVACTILITVGITGWLAFYYASGPFCGV